jgi:4-amino-4-deoxy-L-arabinose transferase-like glycosyltransferase
MDQHVTERTTPQTGAQRGRVPAWLWLALAALLVLRLTALLFNRTDLFFDEAQYWAWSTEPAFGYYSKPPLIAWIIAAATSVCGQAEACIRAPAPILHTATALAVFALGARLYDVRTGALSALAFALLPGVSFSSGIISTDVPLLLCWALALVAFAALFDTKSWWPALVLGLAFGLGLNAKYAMAWFVLCTAVYLIATPARRFIMRDARLWAGFALGLAAIVPNMLWNRANSFATFSHTADNAKWEGALIHPDKAFEFFASQFGVFGPLYFAGLLIIVWRGWKTRLAEADRLLLAFCIPLVALITVQAFLSRAHANWAAIAYVSGVVLVIATLVRNAEWGWLKASYAIHAVLLAVLIAATATAGTLRLPVKPDPMARTLGWRNVANAAKSELARAKASGKPYASVLSDDRSVTAELLYYMRAEPTPVRAWKSTLRPHDHFELTRPFTGGSQEPALLVTLSANPLARGPTPRGERTIADAFTTVEPVSTMIVPTGINDTRRVSLLTLSGYKGP